MVLPLSSPRGSFYDEHSEKDGKSVLRFHCGTINIETAAASVEEDD